MRILTIIGTPHKGNTRAITDLLRHNYDIMQEENTEENHKDVWIY